MKEPVPEITVEAQIVMPETTINELAEVVVKNIHNLQDIVIAGIEVNACSPLEHVSLALAIGL